MISTEDYKERYGILMETEINESIGSKRIGPTYRKNFISFYKESPRSLRIYLRSFIFSKVEDFKNKIEEEKNPDNRSKLEKKLNGYYGLFEDLLLIRGLI